MTQTQEASLFGEETKTGEEATWSNQQRMQTSCENTQKTNKSATCQHIKHGNNRNFIYAEMA